MSCENEETKTTTGEEAAPQGPLTCSVQEFARIAGLSREDAYARVGSVLPPPGFRSGRSYRVIVSRIPGYLDELAERERESRAGAIGKRADGLRSVDVYPGRVIR